MRLTPFAELDVLPSVGIPKSFPCGVAQEHYCRQWAF